MSIFLFMYLAMYLADRYDVYICQFLQSPWTKKLIKRGPGFLATSIQLRRSHRKEGVLRVVIIHSSNIQNRKSYVQVWKPEKEKKRRNSNCLLTTRLHPKSGSTHTRTHARKLYKTSSCKHQSDQRPQLPSPTPGGLV